MPAACPAYRLAGVAAAIALGAARPATAESSAGPIDSLARNDRGALLVTVEHTRIDGDSHGVLNVMVNTAVGAHFKVRGEVGLRNLDLGGSPTLALGNPSVGLWRTETQATDHRMATWGARLTLPMASTSTGAEALAAAHVADRAPYGTEPMASAGGLWTWPRARWSVSSLAMADAELGDLDDALRVDVRASFAGAIAIGGGLSLSSAVHTRAALRGGPEEKFTHALDLAAAYDHRGVHLGLAIDTPLDGSLRQRGAFSVSVTIQAEL